MTNAEKLAKNTARLSEIIADSAKDGCRQCSLHGLGVCSMCHSPVDIEEWLESDINETIDMC